MKLVDANVLLYAVNEADANHEPARAWLDEALSGAETVAFAWIALLAFLRLGTRGGVFPRPLTLEQAAGVVTAWLAAPVAVAVNPAERHVRVLSEFLGRVGTAGNLVNDAHLAALALEHGATIVSFDGDFARFEGVTWEQPGG